MKLRQLDRFTGSEDYDLYRVQFIRHASIMKWTRQDMGHHLNAALTKKALEVLRNIPPGMSFDFDALDEALSRRFGNSESAPEARARLRTLRLKPAQTLQKFAIEVEDAVRAAMPHYPETLLQSEMVTTFIEGLNDPTTAMFLVKENHANLSSALQSARIVPPQILREQRFGRVRHAEAESDGSPAPQGEAAVSALCAGKVEAMVSVVNTMAQSLTTLAEENKKLTGEQKNLARIVRQGRDRSSDRSPDRKRRYESDRDRSNKGDDSKREKREKGEPWYKKVRCFECKEIGHTKRFCPAKKEQSSSNSKNTKND